MIQRKNYHKKNLISAVTARTKKTSIQKSKEKQQRSLRKKIKSRISFASPSGKNAPEDDQYQQFALLNYMILKQRSKSIHKSGRQILKKDSFHVLDVLGKGGFGRVMKVQHKKTKKIYAMKEMSKAVIITKKSVNSVFNERQLLAQLRHPFIVNIIYAFQDRDNLYLIMDLMPGGDLRYQIGKYYRFPQHIVKFFVCCILVGLSYLHQNSIIHRDIKPQNLVIDKQGYLRITDLGVARINTPNNYQDTSGTPGYMSPQVILGQNHSFPVDFFALGVIAYECMLGRRPYRGANRKQIRQQMLLHQVQIKQNQIPQHWSRQSADLINGLLKRKAEKRLGSNGISEIYNHQWFSDIDWNKMVNKKYPSPFMPNMQQRNFDTVSVSEYDEQTQQKLYENKLLLRKDNVQKMFQDYQYEEVKLI